MIKTNTIITGLILVFTVGLFSTLKAQDTRFSQFYASPLNLNPAMTGVFEGRWRVALNYRDQWASVLDKKPFRSVAASYDMRYNIVGDDYLAFGLTTMHDEAGDSRYQTNQGLLSFSYLKQLSGNRYRTNDQYLIVGAQAGMGQSSVQWDNLWFSRQWDSGNEIPDTNLSSGELSEADGNTSSNTYVDFNAGLMWYSLFDDNMSIYAGLAMFHLNQPSISLFDNSAEKLDSRWVVHAGGEIPLTEGLSFLPAFQLQLQGPSKSLTPGFNFRYTNRDWYELAIRAGVWTHFSSKVEGNNMDALIISTVLEMERWNLGFSYDINTSSLSQATNSRGTYELSLIYFQPASRRNNVKCPKF